MKDTHEDNQTSNQEVQSDSGSDDEQIVLAVIGVAVLISNGLVCTLFCRYRTLRTITNTFIVSLAISDLMVAAVFLPTYLARLAASPYKIGRASCRERV